MVKVSESVKYIFPLIVVGSVFTIWYFTRKADNGENGGGIPIVPSWISVPSGISNSDLLALKTYPENPAFGKYILINNPSQGNTWLQPSELASFISPNGEWTVLNYPYGS